MAGPIRRAPSEAFVRFPCSLPEDRNEVKAAIAKGKVDVLTVSPNGRLIPDPGIETR